MAYSSFSKKSKKDKKMGRFEALQSHVDQQEDGFEPLPARQRSTNNAGKRSVNYIQPEDEEEQPLGISEEEYEQVRHIIEGDALSDKGSANAALDAIIDEDVIVPSVKTVDTLQQEVDDASVKADILAEKIAAGTVKQKKTGKNKKYGSFMLSGSVTKKPRLKASWLIAIALLLTVVLVLVLFLSGVMTATPDPVTTPTPTSMGSYPWTYLTPPPIEEQVPITMDISEHAKQLKIDKKRINRPAVSGTEILFSAGNGPIEKPVLTTLYLFDIVTQQLTEVATSKVRNGEIFQYYISSDWLVWLDTDHKGTNIIYKQNRKTKKTSIVREMGNLRPKLMLSGQLLVWMEQISEEEDRLYLLDLDSEEDLVVYEFYKSTYALSTPFIYNNTVVWAGPDPDNPESPNSAIYRLDFTIYTNPQEDDEISPTVTPRFTLDPIDAPSKGPTPTPANLGPWTTPPGYSEDEVHPMYFKPGMYVHEPMFNGEVLVWIDKNKAPDSTLYMKNMLTGETKKIVQGVTSYSVTDRSVVYNYNQEIYAYYYNENVTVRVSKQGQPAILPVSIGNLVVWEDKSPSNEGDVYKYNIVD